MIQFPNCKINLGLNIVGKRSDGFHNIETVFYPIPFHDALEVMPSPDGVFQFVQTGLNIPGAAGNNLCVRAFNLLQADFGLPGVKIHLHKVIPMGSGLGGGSSDGALTLKMLNDLFSIGLDHDRLMDYARLLGSDCAFFIGNRPVFANEKGDHFEPAMIDLSGLFICLVIPDVHVSTAIAYRMLIPEIPSVKVNEVVQLPMDQWKGMLVNDFEKPIFVKFPVIRAIKEKLYKSGAIYASMSGSGSAVYGLFQERPNFGNQFSNCFTWVSP
ncbi:MAG: 4-(cytidine 5'-diphospho)-2-C-methyl-D-erythritol kinase, partial [Bacteroidota bacterium]